jgi:Transcriptional regulator containing an amidase domain and an AraC-type DNA-binding HTH domain
MIDIFKIRELGVCRKAQLDDKTAFTYYEVNEGDDIWNRNLPLNYIIFVLSGVLEISCNEFENRKFKSEEMILMLRSSSVHVKVIKNSKLYVMYFDNFLSPCDTQLFKAYLPDVEKIVYDFRPIHIPKGISDFLKYVLDLQKQKVDCLHFNSIKHREFFILLRRFCVREDLVMFLSPMIGRSLTFRNKVLEKYMQLKGGRVTELADLVGVGRKTFDKRFLNEFGIPPAKWMIQEKAKRLRVFLTEPGVTISDAMDKFHFNSPGHFNRFCHQYFKTSPGAIIKESEALKKKKAKK